MSEPVRLIILGCGGRGTGYANWVRNHPDRAKIVAIAEPRDFYRNRIGDQHNIPEEMRFRSWEEVAAKPKFADAVLICMMDDLHEIPSVAFAGMGYHIMLEKPMAPTEAACRRIADAVRRSKIMFAVCHVLRYTYYTRHVKKLIADGSIGQIVSIQHLEPVGHWHQCHSFVRGNWRNEKETCFMLLANAAMISTGSGTSWTARVQRFNLSARFLNSGRKDGRKEPLPVVQCVRRRWNRSARRLLSKSICATV
ncbi:MAG: Gfo/Idh/MocA family oxidoreductase [Victivallales bacterium]